MSIFLLILGLILFIMLVVVHELGHFIVAKRNGVQAEEFGIFFPPKIWGRKTKKGWEFTINALPLGGFVRLKGEHDADRGKGTYGAASLGVKVKILLAGVVMNLIVAFVILMGLAWIGLPQLVNNQFSVKSNTTYIKHATTAVEIGKVETNSPAAKAGLKSNDTLVAIGSKGHLQRLNSSDTLLAATKKYAGQKVVIQYRRSGQDYQTAATLRTKAVIAAAAKNHVQEGNLGVSVGDQQNGVTLTRSTWSAPIVAGGLMGQFTGLTFHGLGVAIKGLGSTIAGLATGNKTARQAGQTTASSQLSGPIGIYAVLKASTTRGYQLVLMIIALISLSLALMNLLPIPALDGGKLYTTLISNLVFRKKLSAAVENWMYGASFVLLIVLLVLISISDVHKFNL